MTAKQIDNRAKKLEALTEQIKALEAQAEAVKAELKTELEARSVEELATASGAVIRWQTISGTRFDSKAFKAEYPGLYGVYVRQTETKRFSIA